jgi:hypothetical protein
MEDNSKSDEECAVRVTERAWNRVLSNVTGDRVSSSLC